MASINTDNPHSGDGTIFIGGVAEEATLETLEKYFEKYGEITNSVIHTGQFGFITYAKPSVVDQIFEENNNHHVIHGKQVEIKRTIPNPKGTNANELKTNKIFVGGIPRDVAEDELKNLFSKYWNVVEHYIVRDHSTNLKRSRGFGFVVYENEKVVDDFLLNHGNFIDMAGTKVEIKKAKNIT